MGNFDRPTGGLINHLDVEWRGFVVHAPASVDKLELAFPGVASSL